MVRGQQHGGWPLVHGRVFLFFLFGGVLALLMRLQLAVPDNTLLSADFYNQIFTLHGSVMMFLFACPSLRPLRSCSCHRCWGARSALPAPVRLRLFRLLAGWDIPLRLAVLRCGAARRLVHVPAADLRVSTGDRRGHLAAGLRSSVAAIAAAVEMIIGVLKTRPPGCALTSSRSTPGMFWWPPR